MENQQARNLWKRYIQKECTAEESAMLESWYNQEFSDLKELETLDYNEINSQIWEGIRKKRLDIIKKKNQKLWLRVAAAASLFIVVGFGYYFNAFNAFNARYAEKMNKAKPGAYAQDIQPGGNKAILTLADGRKIKLNDEHKGEHFEQPGISITKAADGQLIYKVLASNTKTQDSSVYNTLETPAGGQYQIILQDGSKIWLNALSSIKFPVTFNAANQRFVTLIGQAYFEVAENKNKPFIVQTGKQLVSVLGTHFDINGYPDEPVIKTTLLEGSVRISSAACSKVLKPNEQAVVSDQRIDILPIETSDVIAWKKGKFMFNNEELESILKKVSRWYDVDIKYTDESIKKNIYWGAVSRFGTASKVLKMLETTGDVHFKIEGKTIIVMP